MRVKHYAAKDTKHYNMHLVKHEVKCDNSEEGKLKIKNLLVFWEGLAVEGEEEPVLLMWFLVSWMWTPSCRCSYLYGIEIVRRISQCLIP